MAYAFSGVISPFGSELALADLQARFGGASRVLLQPFPGWAVAFQADYDAFDDATKHDARTSPLVPWSRGWPAQSFAYVEVECFGGVCEQRGFAFRDGEVLLDCDWAEEQRDGAEPPPLVRLLEALGVHLEGGDFEPFTRGYFPARRGAERGP